MASIWGPAGMTKEEELFNQQIQAPEGAPLKKGFWETITPQILGAVANAFVPGSKEAVATATNELQGGDPVQTQTPVFNGKALDPGGRTYGQAMVQGDRGNMPMPGGPLADPKLAYNNLWTDPTRAIRPGEELIPDGIWHHNGVNYTYGSNPNKQYGAV